MPVAHNERIPTPCKHTLLAARAGPRHPAPTSCSDVVCMLLQIKNYVATIKHSSFVKVSLPPAANHEPSCCSNAPAGPWCSNAVRACDSLRLTTMCRLVLMPGVHAEPCNLMTAHTSMCFSWLVAPVHLEGCACTVPHGQGMRSCRSHACKTSPERTEVAFDLTETQCA